MTENKRITLHDVALRADVSAATVSRALREPERVSNRLRKRIDVAIEVLGYVPDSAAQALASGRTNVIGVLIPSVTNNVFSAVLQGIQTAVENTRFDIQFGYTRYSTLIEESQVRLFLSQRPAGLIVAGIDQSETARTLLESAACPIVQIMEISDDPIDSIIGFSHYDAARAAARHLMEMGYRNLGFLGARMDPRAQRRFAGFRDETVAAGTFRADRVRTTPRASTVTLGCQLFAELMERAPETDAIFCINDDLALGALFEAQRRNIDIPGRLGICGFNDLEMMAAACPSITSVRTFRREMGEQSLRMLAEAIEKGQRRTGDILDLGFEIRPRQSTARTA